jgi:hypothetical protein
LFLLKRDPNNEIIISSTTHCSYKIFSIRISTGKNLFFHEEKKLKIPWDRTIIPSHGISVNKNVVPSHPIRSPDPHHTTIFFWRDLFLFIKINKDIYPKTCWSSYSCCCQFSPNIYSTNFTNSAAFISAENY